MTKESKADLKEKFIELRAASMSYENIAGQLNVSKPTLITWAKELQKEIGNARTVRMDELFERFAVAKTKRIEVFGKRLDAILTELDKRDLSEVKTEALLTLALKYGEMMRNEHEPLLLKGEESALDYDFSTTETWPA